MTKNGLLHFANAALAKTLAEAAYPNATIHIIEHGYDNIVVLVDEQYALRFPRNNNAYARSQYEKQVLRHLETLQTIAIPKVLSEHENPPYLTTSFVAGEHLSPEMIRRFPIKQQEQVGRDVATFAYTMHSLFSLDEAQRIRKELHLDECKEEPWNIYFERLLHSGTLSNPEQNTIAKDYFKKWRQLDDPARHIVVHDDLHTENLLFKEHRLSGVLDFGDTNIGIPEQELRQLYRINETILKAAIDAYSALSGQVLDIEAAKTWAIMQEIGTYIEHLATHTTVHPSFSRAAGNLNRWFNTDIWGKGYAEPSTKSRQ